MKRVVSVSILSFLALFGGYKFFTKVNLNPEHQVGDVVDSLNGVDVFYNGGVNNVSGRELAVDGYNIGLKYQCVEFIKRYYYEHFNHKMPDSHGHAKDFFDHEIASGELNKKRGLLQYKNGIGDLPKVGDIVVYDWSLLNPYGHVSIVSEVDLQDKTIEIIQQNPGPFSSSRERYAIENSKSGWLIANDRILGWLHKDGHEKKIES